MKHNRKPSAKTLKKIKSPTLQGLTLGEFLLKSVSKHSPPKTFATSATQRKEKLALVKKEKLARVQSKRSRRINRNRRAK